MGGFGRPPSPPRSGRRGEAVAPLDTLIRAGNLRVPPRSYTDPGMAYNAWFQCINGCPGQFDLREVIYRCPTCGDLLEVQHDMEALRSRSAAAWMQLFKDRYRRHIYRSA